MNKIIEVMVMAFTIGLTGALVPGPTLVATVNSSLETGWVAGPKVAIGHALVELAVFLLIIDGLAMATKQYAHHIALVGGLALIIFGLLTLKGSRTASLTTNSKNGCCNPYVAGILTSAANPYFWIWWLSIGSAFLIEGLRGGLFIACIFMIGHWGADFGWYTLVSTSLDRGKSILSETSYHYILALCGAFLVLFGIYYMSNA